uniref:Uncharacterized protein n=1 Tax=Falco tinnunculus TaxID=100819 RepID=A0A8C4VBD5_FALTI
EEDEPFRDEVAESWEEAIMQKESRESKSPPKWLIVIQDDSLPSGPLQISILYNRPAFLVKSLVRREVEYMEARKLVLDSTSPEEEQEKPILGRPARISQLEDTRQPSNVIRQT